ncbi:hypothetical protein [Shewanella litoralis]|uniref:DUF2721 domain-containing protein n=1 Tax=Shewanella litoralis TaxID=2282700 RepID=A0ABQ2RMZ7_9GAMM|nr:hypothetical protein [Shewanella litoralis]GGQ33766.1 hypothetical protein GCM10009411_36490 [Shewanella litoralis]
MEQLNDITIFISMIVTVAGLAKTIHYFRTSKFAKEVKKYEIFKEVKILIEEDEVSNLPIISMAIQCLSKRDMTLEEIKWFIYTTNSSKHLRTYSEQKQFITIATDNKSFVFKEKYSSLKSRILELCKLLALYSIIAGYGFYIIAGFSASVELDMVIIYGSIAATCIIIGLFFLLKFFILIDAHKTIKHRFSSNFKDAVKILL